MKELWDPEVDPALSSAHRDAESRQPDSIINDLLHFIIVSQSCNDKRITRAYRMFSRLFHHKVQEACFYVEN